MVILPSTEKKLDPFDAGKELFDEVLVMKFFPIAIAADKEPEAGIDSAGSAAVADSALDGVNVAGDFTVRALVVHEGSEGF